MGHFYLDLSPKKNNFYLVAYKKKKKKKVEQSQNHLNDCLRKKNYALKNIPLWSLNHANTFTLLPKGKCWLLN